MLHMIRTMLAKSRRSLALAALGAVLLGVLALPNQAQARVFIGLGFPFYVGPPAYYPPPVYYPPPPAYYPPPPGYYPPSPGYYPPPAYYPSPPGAYAPAPAPAGQSCYAGGTVCPMERPVPSGSSCYCTTAQGRVSGRAN